MIEVLNIEIRRPNLEDMHELHQFFRLVVTDTFIKEGIGHLSDDIEMEIETKKNYLKQDLESNGEKRYFLIALNQNKIIGTIEYGKASDLIRQCTANVLQDTNEVGTVFVHPEYQRRGIGSMLLNKMLITLHNRKIKEFCLDSGYKNAQEFGRKSLENRIIC